MKPYKMNCGTCMQNDLYTDAAAQQFCDNYDRKWRKANAL